MRSESIMRGLIRTNQNPLISLIACITYCNARDYRGKRTNQKEGLISACVQSLTLCVLMVCGLIGLSLSPKGGERGCLVQPSPSLGLKAKGTLKGYNP